jgi:hypothetical protein
VEPAHNALPSDKPVTSDLVAGNLTQSVVLSAILKGIVNARRQSTEPLGSALDRLEGELGLKAVRPPGGTGR